jgi:hypothetical protein
MVKNHTVTLWKYLTQLFHQDHAVFFPKELFVNLIHHCYIPPFLMGRGYKAYTTEKKAKADY